MVDRQRRIVRVSKCRRVEVVFGTARFLPAVVSVNSIVLTAAATATATATPATVAATTPTVLPLLVLFVREVTRMRLAVRCVYSRYYC